MKQTPNMQLNKPEYSDVVDIEKLNENFDKIDHKIAEVSGQIVSADATTNKAGLMSASDKIKLDGIAKGANKTTVDSAMSEVSSNPVQNKVVKQYIDSKAFNGGSGSVTKEDFVVNITFDSTSATTDDSNLAVFNARADKTFAEISSAVAEGKNVYGMCDGLKWPLYMSSSTTHAFRGHIQLANLFGTVGMAITVCSIWQDGCNVEVSAGELPVPALDGTDDGKGIVVSGSKWTMKKYIDSHGSLPAPELDPTYVQALVVDKYTSEYKLKVFDDLELPGAAESTNAPQTRSVKYALDRKAGKDAATAETDGLMPAADKAKLDGIEEGANKTVVDEALDATSTNPVQNKAVKAALNGKAGTAVATPTADGLMSASDKTKLDSVEDGANKTTVDAAMDAASENPVQNKAVKAALDGKLDKTGGTVTGNLRVTGALFSGDGLSFGTGENIHFTKAADDAGKLAHGTAGVDDTVPLARLKVAAPTESDDAATKAYVDNNAAGAGAVRYDAAQTLDAAQQFQARKNIDAVGNYSPQFQGFLALSPANETLGSGVGLSPTGSGHNYTLDISDVDEGNPTLLTGVKTPTDADANAAATVEYVKAKVAGGGGVTVDTAMSGTSTNPVQNKTIKQYVDDHAVSLPLTLTYASGQATGASYSDIRKAIESGRQIKLAVANTLDIIASNVKNETDKSKLEFINTSVGGDTIDFTKYSVTAQASGITVNVKSMQLP